MPVSPRPARPIRGPVSKEPAYKRVAWRQTDRYPAPRTSRQKRLIHHTSQPSRCAPKASQGSSIRRMLPEGIDRPSLSLFSQSGVSMHRAHPRRQRLADQVRGPAEKQATTPPAAAQRVVVGRPALHLDPPTQKNTAPASAPSHTTGSRAHTIVGPPPHLSLSLPSSSRHQLGLTRPHHPPDRCGWRRTREHKTRRAWSRMPQ
jgi:hypothetical protein